MQSWFLCIKFGTKLQMFKIFEAFGVLSTYKLNKQCAKIWYAQASSSPNPPPSVGKLVQYIYFNNSVGMAFAYLCHTKYFPYSNSYLDTGAFN